MESVCGLLWTQEWPAQGNFGRALAVLSLFLKCSSYCWPVSWYVFHIDDSVLEDPGSLLAMAYVNVPCWRRGVPLQNFCPLQLLPHCSEKIKQNKKLRLREKNCFVMGILLLSLQKNLSVGISCWCSLNTT